jgi:hypothetical protein
MAKKSVRKNLNKKAIAPEKIIYFLYENGFLQSTIVHTIVLLIMALIVIKEVEKKPIKISLSFAATSDQENVSLDRVLEFSKTEIQEDAIDVFEQQNNSKIAETLVSTNDLENTAIDNVVLDEERSNQSFVDEVSLTDLNKEFKTKEKQLTSTRESQIATSDRNSTDTNNLLEELSKTLSNGSTNSGNINPFGNSDGNIGNRLAAAGAKTGDVQISIAWGTRDDIDLHVAYTPGNGSVDKINWTNRIGMISAGMLDIDMNANSSMLNATPVENVFWPPGSSPNGFFIVYIHFFRSWTNNTRIPVIVRVKIRDNITEYNAQAILGSSPIEVTRFKFAK